MKTLLFLVRRAINLRIFTVITDENGLISFLFHCLRATLGMSVLLLHQRKLALFCSFEHSSQFVYFAVLDKDQFAHVLRLALKGFQNYYPFLAFRELLFETFVFPS
jgi:hypothetical protein